jgi:aspartyl-tRNA(Asn)/glutamyl-tRNA(Gln) amidotransferase subunit B
MEKGEMRVEANISISEGDTKGTKVEIKNLNSFRAMERAIEYEISRHEAILKAGEVVLQETRGWDEATQTTFSQRSKEDAHDYRYFPDPDIPPLYISDIQEFDTKSLLEEMPELPDETRERYRKELNLREDSIEALLSSVELRELFEAALEPLKGRTNSYQVLANYVLSDVAGLITASSRGNLSPTSLAETIILIDEGKLSSRGAKDLIKELYLHGGSAEIVASEKGLFQDSDEGALREIVLDVIKENPLVADEVRAGKKEALQFLIGQGMKLSRGNANPTLLSKLLKEVLHN